MHLPDLLKDLAIILGLAAVGNVICRRLKQPVVLGYILAGILAGPHFPWLPTVTDVPNIRVLAELGVVFLLFSLGLEFSFSKLLKIGLAATCIALIEVAGMGALGFGFGQALGWSSLDSVFLGGILSISSTTIIIKAFDELNLKTRAFTQTVFGVLIMEDLVAILILISLSTIAISREIQGPALLVSLGKLAVTVPLIVVAGIFVVPRVLRRVRVWLNEESLLIFALGLCLVLVLLGSALGYSAALGAFVAGAILAEASEGKRIEELVQPVRNLFGAIFFVSVGMLFDPVILRDHPWIVVGVTLVTIVGKALSTSAGALIAGQGLKPSVQAGLSMAQIGEFSFIIASLGASLKVTSELLYPLAVAVALVTSFSTPYLIRFSDPLSSWLERTIPARVLDALRYYESALKGRGLRMQEGGMRSRLQVYFEILRGLLRTEHPPYQELAPWSAHLSRLIVEPNSALAGRTLRDLDVRGHTGANVLVIERAGSAIVAPDPDEMLFPLDEILVLGTDEQLQLLRPLVLKAESSPFARDEAVDYRLEAVTVMDGSSLIGQKIRETGIREKFGGLVAGVERDGLRMANPGSDLRLLAGDVLWIVCPGSKGHELASMAKPVGALEPASRDSADKSSGNLKE